MGDPSEIKRRIVRALCRSARALREAQAAWADGPVDGEDQRGLALCSALEAALVHGLRAHLLRAEQAWLPLWRWWAPGPPAAPLPNPHFWPMLGAVTHSNVMEQLNSLKFVRTDVGRCRAWLRVALNDGLLACYVDSLLSDAAALAQWYEPGALLRDAEQSPALLDALQGLDSVNFQLSYRSAALDQWTPGPLALAGLCPAEESRETALAEPPVALGTADGKDGDASGPRPPVSSPEAERVTERDRADSTSLVDGVEAERENRTSHSQIDLLVGGGIAQPTARGTAEPSRVAIVPSASDSNSVGPAAATGRAGSGRGESPSAEEATSVARQQEAPPKAAAESNVDSNPFAKMLAWIKEAGLASGDQGREASFGEPPVTTDERVAPDIAVEFPSSVACEADSREQKVSGKEAKASSSEPPVSVIDRALPGGDHHDGTLDGVHSDAELELPPPPPTEPQQGTTNPEATRGCSETIGLSDATGHRERGPELTPNVERRDERRAHPSQPLFMEVSDLNKEMDAGDILFSRHLHSHPKKKAKKPRTTAQGVLFEDPKGAKEMPCKFKSAVDANTGNAGKPSHAKGGPNQSSSDCSRENKNVSFCKEPCPDLKANLGSDRESHVSLPEIQISHDRQGDFTKRSGQDENTTADPPSQSPRGTSVVVEGDNSPQRAGNTGDSDAVDSTHSPNLISTAVSNIAKASGCLPANDSSDDDFYGHYPDGSGEAEPLGGASGARISRTSATRKSRKVTRRRKDLGPIRAAARAGEMAVPAAVAALLPDVQNRHQGGRSSCSSIEDDDIVVVVHRKNQGGAEDPFGGVRKMGLLLKRRRMKTWKEYFCELTASELRLYLPDGRAADNPAPPPSPVDAAAAAGETARPFAGALGERPGHGAVAVSLNDGYVLHKAYSLRMCQSVALLGLAKLSVYAAPADCLELSFAGQKLFFQAGSADDAEDWVERLREVLHEMGHRAVDE